ncbi:MULTISPECIES: nitrogen fixation protein NifQ [Rhizobium]
MCQSAGFILCSPPNYQQCEEFQSCFRSDEYDTEPT